MAPVFSEETLNKNILYKKLVGEKFSIFCQALGNYLHLIQSDIPYFKQLAALYPPPAHIYFDRYNGKYRECCRYEHYRPRRPLRAKPKKANLWIGGGYQRS